jgi:putative flippase GtrA
LVLFGLLMKSPKASHADNIQAAAMSPPPLLRSFTKAQISSAVATVADWSVLFGLVEVLQVWYVVAVAIGAIVGAITNFVINRHWSFRATHGKWQKQAVRYSLASALSAALNTAGVYAMTDWLKVHYSISVLAVSIVVGILFNYPLHRFFVFR